MVCTSSRNGSSVTTRPRPDDVAAFIGRIDPAFRPLIRRIGPPPNPRPARVDERYGALVRSIIFQLISTAAGRTIQGRVTEMCGGDITPESILATGPDVLRTAGVSRTKAEAMVSLAENVQGGLVRLDLHGRWDDATVEADVTKIRGIGPWTAHMYLMFSLARADVWPTGDLGVRVGWSKVHELDDMISPRDLAREGERFPGVRSALSWYCWRAIEDEDFVL